MTAPQKLLTLDDIANLLAVSIATVRTWACREPHRLPPRQAIPGSPRLWRFHPAVVAEWLAGGMPAPMPRQAKSRPGRKRA